MTSTAQFLKGDCWISGVVPSGDLFDVISMNVTMGTKDGEGIVEYPEPPPPSYRPRLCDPNDGTGNFIMSYVILRGMPYMSPVPKWTKQFYPQLYGKSSIQEFDDPTWRFDEAEASAWDAIVINNPNWGGTGAEWLEPQFITLAGPKYKYIQCFQRLFKRLPDKEFVGKYKKMMNVNGVRWQGSTDGNRPVVNYPNKDDYYGREHYPIDNTDPQLYYDRGDWLTNLLPASPVYCNPIDQPLLGEKYYEDAHFDGPAPQINKTKQNFRADFMPFCTPLNVRNEAGTVIGAFDGLAFQGFFNYAGMLSPQIPTFDFTYAKATIPVEPYEDYPLIPSHKQLLSFELWIYLSATGNIKSPRVAQMRWWYYSDYLTIGSGSAPFFDPITPFRPYLFFNAFQENMDIFLTLKLTNGLTKNVVLPLHRLQVAVRS